MILYTTEPNSEILFPDWVEVWDEVQADYLVEGDVFIAGGLRLVCTRVTSNGPEGCMAEPTKDGSIDFFVKLGSPMRPSKVLHVPWDAMVQRKRK